MLANGVKGIQRTPIKKERFVFRLDLGTQTT